MKFFRIVCVEEENVLRKSRVTAEVDKGQHVYTMESHPNEKFTDIPQLVARFREE